MIRKHTSGRRSACLVLYQAPIAVGVVDCIFDSGVTADVELDGAELADEVAVDHFSNYEITHMFYAYI
jgi:hypothetical protein